MNKDYLEYQYSKSKKLTERAFKLRISMLMLSMLACAAVMASSAFALFTCDINRSTTLTAAEFKIVNSYTRDARTIGEKIVTINTTPGVVGYCKITVIDPDEVQHWYYTNAFCGTMNLRITAAAECQIIVDTPRWGYPQLNGIEPELIIGDGGTINIPIPEPQEITSNETTESTGGGGQGVSQETEDNETDNTPTENETEDNNEVIKAPMLSVSPSVNEEKTTVTENEVTEKETTSVVEKAETTVAPAVSEEKASVENNNSTAAEAPAPSTPPSGDSSDSGSSGSSVTNAAVSDSGSSSGSGNSSDSGNSSNSSSGSSGGGSDAPSGGDTTSSASDGGGE